MNIRLLQVSDYKQYLELLSELTVVGNINYDNFVKRFEEINKINLMFIYVLFDENTIVSAGTLFIEPKFIHNCSNLGHIEDVVVNKKYRGNGYGKFIIKYLSNIAKQKGCYKVRLVCNQNNVVFYEKCDFLTNGIEMTLKL